MITTIWTNIQTTMAGWFAAVATFLYDHPAAIVALAFLLIVMVVHWWITPPWGPSEDDDHDHCRS